MRNTTRFYDGIFTTARYVTDTDQCIFVPSYEDYPNTITDFR